MDTNDRIEDFVLGMACTLKKAKRDFRRSGGTDGTRAELEKARKSFMQSLRMYRESSQG